MYILLIFFYCFCFSLQVSAFNFPLAKGKLYFSYIQMPFSSNMIEKENIIIEELFIYS